MTIISAAYGLPDARAGIARDFAIVVEGNRIVATGDRAAMLAAYPAAEAEHFDGMLMTPAFVNSHDHGRGLGTASLGIADDILEAWLLTLRTQPAIDPYLAAAYDGARLLRSGVTLTTHSHNPRDWRRMGAEAEATLRGYRDSGIRVAFHPPIVDQNNLTYEDQVDFVERLPADLVQVGRGMLASMPLSPADYFELCDALYAAHHDAVNHTVHIQASPAGGQWCSDDLTMACVAWAKSHDTRVQMHMLETRYQRDYARRTFGKSFIRHLDDIGALGLWLTLAHMVWVDLDDLGLLAERGVCIAHNPSSNLRLRSGIAPIAEMAQAGITLGIGLDGHALDDDQDYLRELRMAYTLSALRAAEIGDRATGLSLPDTLHIGTLGGSHVTLGLFTTPSLGKLAPQYLADVVLLDVSKPPQAWLMEQGKAQHTIVHSATRNQVKRVMANGEWVIIQGRSVRVDEAALLTEIAGNIQIARSRTDQTELRAAERIAASIHSHLTTRA